MPLVTRGAGSRVVSSGGDVGLDMVAVRLEIRVVALVSCSVVSVWLLVSGGTPDFLLGLVSARLDHGSDRGPSADDVNPESVSPPMMALASAAMAIAIAAGFCFVKLNSTVLLNAFLPTLPTTASLQDAHASAQLRRRKSWKCMACRTSILRSNLVSCSYSPAVYRLKPDQVVMDLGSG